MVAKFDLIRLKMNVIKGDSTGRPIYYGRGASIPAGLVDISIPDSVDHELNRFWETEKRAPGSQLTVVDVDVGGGGGSNETETIQVTIPTIDALIDDLDKMLTVYECPAFKQERRINCMRVLQALQLNKEKM